MKALVVYYSLEGNTAHIAQSIAQAVDADLLRLLPVQDVKAKGVMRYFWGGRQVLSKGLPELQPYELDLSLYTHLFIGSPVWASSYAPALRTFLDAQTLRDKQIGLFCCYAGSEGKCITQLRAALAGNAVAEQAVTFRDPLKHDPAAAARRATDWARTIVADPVSA